LFFGSLLIALYGSAWSGVFKMVKVYAFNVHTYSGFFRITVKARNYGRAIEKAERKGKRAIGGRFAGVSSAII
jgi:hypothetical protein